MSEPVTESPEATTPSLDRPQPGRRRPQQLLMLGIASVLVLVLAGIGLALYVNRAPAKMAVSGGVTVAANPSFYADQATFDVLTKPGAPNCQVGPSGADLPGSQLVISDASGKTVGVGTLGQAVWQDAPTYVPGSVTSGGSCLIPFRVDSVTKGSSYYTVAISGHGSVKFTAAQVQEPLSLDLN